MLACVSGWLWSVKMNALGSLLSYNVLWHCMSSLSPRNSFLGLAMKPCSMTMKMKYQKRIESQIVLQNHSELPTRTTKVPTQSLSHVLIQSASALLLSGEGFEILQEKTVLIDSMNPEDTGLTSWIPQNNFRFRTLK